MIERVRPCLSSRESKRNPSTKAKPEAANATIRISNPLDNYGGKLGTLDLDSSNLQNRQSSEIRHDSNHLDDRDNPANVIGMARRGGAQIDQTASSASPSPTSMRRQSTVN